MARPLKRGIDYFPLDVDFLQDEKVRILKARFGADGVMLYIYLLCRIYREGYYLPWSEDTEYIVADELGMSHEKVRQVLKFLLERSLFEDTLFQSDTILTSAGIQKRYQEAVKTRATKTPINIKDYWLLDVDETASWLKVSHNADNSENNASFSEKNSDESMEEVHKVEQSRTDKSKAEGVGSAASESEPVSQKTVFQSYMENINPTPGTSIVDAVNAWIRDGVEEEMMILAIEDAAANNARSWKYIDAILKRCVADGVKTAEQYKARQKKWQRNKGSGSKQSGKSVIGNFKQREYSDDEIDSLTYIPIPKFEEDNDGH